MQGGNMKHDYYIKNQMCTVCEGRPLWKPPGAARPKMNAKTCGDEECVKENLRRINNLRYKVDPEFRERTRKRTNARKSFRYHNDPEFREKNLKYSANYFELNRKRLMANNREKGHSIFYHQKIKFMYDTLLEYAGEK